jgi:hypothetical protein
VFAIVLWVQESVKPLKDVAAILVALETATNTSSPNAISFQVELVGKAASVHVVPSVDTAAFTEPEDIATNLSRPNAMADQVADAGNVEAVQDAPPSNEYAAAVPPDAMAMK